MTTPIKEDNEAKIEIDLTKLAPLGLIPSLIVLIVVLGFGSKITQGNAEVKKSVEQVSLKVDSLGESNEEVIKLACDQFDKAKIRLTKLKCP